MPHKAKDLNSVPRDNRGFVEHWKKAGAMLAEVRCAELRNYDYDQHREAILALLELAVAHAPPRLTSGLVEQQRLFMAAMR
jgi:hypothetical protein